MGTILGPFEAISGPSSQWEPMDIVLDSKSYELEFRGVFWFWK